MTATQQQIDRADNLAAEPDAGWERLAAAIAPPSACVGNLPAGQHFYGPLGREWVRLQRHGGAGCRCWARCAEDGHEDMFPANTRVRPIEETRP